MVIDLIDGEQFCLLLKEKGLGVVTETVDPESSEWGRCRRSSRNVGTKGVRTGVF